MDSFVQYSFNASQIRGAFARLARELFQRGESEGAVKVLDHCMEQIPVVPGGFRWSMQHIPLVRAYYAVGATEKGDAILVAFANVMKEYIDYFTRFPEQKHGLIANQMDEKLAILAELHRIAEANGRTEITEDIIDYFYK